MSLTIPQINLISPEDGAKGYVCEECGITHTRVTEILRATCPKFALVPWAEGCGRKAALAVYQADGKLPATETLLKERIKALGMAADDFKEAGGNRGSIVHEFLHEYAKTGVVASFAHMPDAVRPYLQQLSKFLFEYEPEFLCSEVALAHHGLDYAGTMDGIAVIGKQPPRKNKPYDLTGKQVLFDIKSSREGRVYPPEQLYQVGMYEYAWQDLGGEPNDHQVVVAIGEEKYQVMVSWFDPESVVPLVEFYHSQREQMENNPNGRKKR